jgi:hypothetical protein
LVCENVYKGREEEEEDGDDDKEEKAIAVH